MRKRLLCSCCILAATTLSVLNCRAADTTPPIIDRLLPPAGATVQQLSQIEVLFSEPVQGVDASDLLINGVPATGLTFGVPGQFTFDFAEPATGTVQIAWAPNHGITDLEPTPNPFAGGGWTYLLDPNAVPPIFVINEFLAANKTGLRDEDGDLSDWIEILNPASVPGNLQGWYLTDDRFDLTKWRFPNTPLGAGQYLVVFASNKNRTNNSARLHSNFQLNSDGEYLALVDPQTNVVSAFVPNYPKQVDDVSYGRDRLSPDQVGYFTTPTPGGPNSTTGAGFAPEVSFSRSSGTFVTNAPFFLTLRTPVPNATIYYVLGINPVSVTNVPGTNSLVYTNPIRITNSTVVRTRAIVPGLLPGPITTKFYIALANQTNVVNFNSDLPIMILHNFGGGTVPSFDQRVVVQTFGNDFGRSSMTNAPDLAEWGIFHLRGSSTIGYPKGSFVMEVQDEFRDGKNVSLLGLPEESDWVLYAPNNFEPALFHNPLAYQLSRDIGRYASRTRFVEVYLKDDAAPAGPVTSADYNGIYVLEEKIKRDKNRVDVERLDPQDTNAPAVTGGYIFSIDRGNGQPGLSAGGASMNWIYPNGFDMTNAFRAPQLSYIRDYFNTFNTQLNSTNWTNATGYAAYIDVDSWIDHHIHNVVTFNVDALRLSGYFFKNRNKRIEYGPVWDFDRTQGSTDSRDFNPRLWRSNVPDLGTDFFNFTPWWARLFNSPDFWQRWIDRYQELRTGGLSTNNIFARIDGFADELRAAQPRELARWNVAPRSGSVSAGGFSYNFGSGLGYQSEVMWKKVWYSNRLDFIDNQFLPPPLLSSPAGLVPPAFPLTLLPGAGAGNSVIYTLDGSDPRLPGGAISPTALVNNGPITIVLTNNVRIFARSRNPNHVNLTGANNPPISSPWSGPTVGTFYVAAPPLRITEIMYHPPPPPPGNTNDADNFEYLELKNIGATPLNLNRFRLRGGIQFDFPNLSLGPAQYVLVVKNIAAYQSRYGTGSLIAGAYTNNLGNGGDHIKLEGGLREPILDFDYKDDWYPITDGAGFSLQIIDENAALDSWGLKSSWRPSGVVNGTPGAPDPSAPTIAPIYVNEALTHTDPSPGDAIELHNPTAAPVNIGGWFLTDDFGAPRKYRIPNGTTIPANGYSVFYQSNSFGVGPGAFALSSKGDQLYLFSGNSSSNLSGYVHGFDFGAQANGVTFGRYLISSGNDHFVTQVTPTLGSANSGPKVGPVVITEISYHPPDLAGVRGTLNNNERDEYIELQNISGTSAPLYDPLFPTNTWRLRDAVDYTFPQGVSIAAGAYVLVVPIDPSDTAAAAAFRARNNVPVAVPLYGPFQGHLDNAEDSVELVRPDVPQMPPVLDAGFVPYLLADKVKYEDLPPWPVAADGLGPTLQRIVPAAYGNDPTNWTAAARTPGAGFGGGTSPTVTTQPVDLTVFATHDAMFSVAVSDPGPVNYQWRFNGNVLPGATSATLLLSNVQPGQAGAYHCVVWNPSGAVLSSNATLTVLLPVAISQQPQNVSLRGSTNDLDYGFTTNKATFAVLAVTVRPTPIRYQWRFNGDPLAGQTNVTLTIDPVGLANDGLYDVMIADDISSAMSQPARLAVLITPVVLQPPLNQTVVSNGSFTASVVIRGNPPPFRYEWREISNARATNITSAMTNYFTFSPVTNLLARNWRLVIFNDANPAPGTLAQFSVAALPDSDGDGIPDDWETAFGFSPTSDADRDIDSDGDGMSNWAEYFAGTDPTNAMSHLRVDLTTLPGTAIVRVGAISNRTYTVQYTDALSSGLWRKLGDIVARTTNHAESFPDAGFASNRFYRVVFPRQP